MNALPDVATYQELGALAPEPDEPEDCPDCGAYFCRPDCRPRPASDEREPVAKEDR